MTYLKNISLCNIQMNPSKKGDRKRFAIARNFSPLILKCWKRRMIKLEKQFNEQNFLTKSLQKYAFF